MLKFAEKNLPDDKKIFLICTYGGSANYRSIEQILNKKHSKVIGKFGCKGYDTFGPFKLIGGIAKGHPDEEDIKNAVEFVKGLDVYKRQAGMNAHLSKPIVIDEVIKTILRYVH